MCGRRDTTGGGGPSALGFLDGRGLGLGLGLSQATAELLSASKSGSFWCRPRAPKNRHARPQGTQHRGRGLQVRLDLRQQSRVG